MPPQRAARMFTQMAQPTQAQVSPGRVSPLPYPVYESGSMRGKAMPPYMDLQQRAAAQAQAMPPRPMPLEQAAMRAAQIRGAFGGQRAPQAPAAGGMGRIADAFRQPLTSPTGQGIAAAALTGLEYGGPSMTPTSLGQGLARMGAAGLQAYAGAQAAEMERNAAARQAAFDRAVKIAELNIKAKDAEGKAGGMFKGTGFKAGAFNMLIDLAPKIEKGTATAPEMQAYSLAYGEAAAPRTIRSYDDQGNETIETIPGANMSQFPKPKGYVEPEVTIKPSPKGIKRSEFASQLQTMGSMLNRYRNTLMAETFDRADMASGASGFPTEEMAEAAAQAEALRLKLKELYDLGALVGGDFQILDNLLTSPNSVKAAKAGKTTLLRQLDQLEREVQGKLKEKELEGVLGLYLNPIKIQTRDDWDEVPVGAFALRPDGTIVYKER